MKLSIVIPAFNEARYIGALLDKIRDVDLSSLGVAKEIIVVDDGSTDDTVRVVEGYEEVILERLPDNQGKGAAVRTGIDRASGDFLIIQDADLEYDPNDYVPMLRALTDDGVDAVYGSRYLKYPRRGRLVNLLSGKHPGQSWTAYIGGQSLSLVALLLLGRWISDTVTALKLFRREVIAPLDLETTGFELDHEISSKLLAAKRTLREVPISYFPRTKAEGKKIGLKDWFRAVRTFLRFRNG